MTVSRAYGHPLSAVLAWSAVDVLIAAWSHGRASASENYGRHQLAMYSGHLTARAFNDPAALQSCAQELAANAPAWDRAVVSRPSTSFDAVIVAMQAHAP